MYQQRNNSIDTSNVAMKNLEVNNENNRRMKLEEYHHDCNLSYGKAKFTQRKLSLNIPSKLGDPSKCKGNLLGALKF